MASGAASVAGGLERPTPSPSVRNVRAASCASTSGSAWRFGSSRSKRRLPCWAPDAAAGSCGVSLHVSRPAGPPLADGRTEHHLKRILLGSASQQIIWSSMQVPRHQKQARAHHSRSHFTKAGELRKAAASASNAASMTRAAHALPSSSLWRGGACAEVPALQSGPCGNWPCAACAASSAAPAPAAITALQDNLYACCVPRGRRGTTCMGVLRCYSIQCFSCNASGARLKIPSRHVRSRCDA